MGSECGMNGTLYYNKVVNLVRTVQVCSSLRTTDSCRNRRLQECAYYLGR